MMISPGSNSIQSSKEGSENAKAPSNSPGSGKGGSVVVGSVVVVANPSPSGEAGSCCGCCGCCCCCCVCENPGSKKGSGLVLLRVPGPCDCRLALVCTVDPIPNPPA